MKLRPYLFERTRLVIDGKALNDWLAHYHIKQADLARMTGLSRMHISDIIAGKRTGSEEAVDLIDRGLTKLIIAARARVSRE